ncbi:MAG: FtsQ-type POTRA domain-containing protein [Betaproteobacteria bacterium]|nr:FtsQ-type POTRA domain-containing protein [Betaproteobacteria bacterium]
MKGTSVMVLLAAVGAGLLVGLALGSLHIYRYATNSPFFATKTVNITGNVRLQRDTVLDLTGVHPGDNSLAVSIAGMEKSISQSPWVEEVSVKRILPDRFDIRLKERSPWFWVRQEGLLYYADEFGRPIAPVESANFMSLPALEIQTGAEDLLPNVKKYVAELKGNAIPVDYAAISWIRLSPGKGVEVYVESRDIHLSIAPVDWSANVNRLGVVLGDLARRNELSLVREVRAADGNVWVIRKS